MEKRGVIDDSTPAPERFSGEKRADVAAGENAAGRLAEAVDAGLRAAGGERDEAVASGRISPARITGPDA